MPDQLSDDWWYSLEGDSLEQGHLLTAAPLPRFVEGPLYNPKAKFKAEVNFERVDVITLSQSCDYADTTRVLVASAINVGKAREIHKFTDETFQDIRDLRRPHWVMLESPNGPDDKEGFVLVDLRKTTPLPIVVLKKIASGMGARPALRPPYVEYLSAAIGHYFCRVALPRVLPNFIDRERPSGGAAAGAV